MIEHDYSSGKKLLVSSINWIINNKDAAWEGHVALVSSSECSTVSTDIFRDLVQILFNHSIRHYVFVGTNAEERHDLADDVLIELPNGHQAITVFYEENAVNDAVFYVDKLAFVGSSSPRTMLAVVDNLVQSDIQIVNLLQSECEIT